MAKKQAGKGKAKTAAKKPAPQKKTAKAAKAKPAARPQAKAAAKATKKAATPAVVHWEVQAKDPKQQQQFFASLFGWKVDADNPMSYGMVSSAGKDSIGGGIGPTDGNPFVTFYVQVPSIDATLAKVESLGGKTIMPRTDIGMIIMGQFRDPEGNVIGVVEG